MGYMGFGMRKEVYSRKPKEPFAYRKTLLKYTDGVLKGAVLEAHEAPTEILIKPLSRKDKLMIGLRLIVAVAGLLFLGFVFYVVFYALVS